MKDLEAHAARIARDGYTILEDAIEPEFVDALSGDLLRPRARARRASGAQRLRGDAHDSYLQPARARDALRAHPGPCRRAAARRGGARCGCLVSSLSSIAIGPGETAQPIHADDQLIPLAKPHVATVCNTMWALTDFTEANGATRIIPGSHLGDHSPIYGRHYDSIAAEMRRGSVLVWHGSLWHGGGGNRTDARRVGIAMNYCAGWIRQQENQQLGIPREVVQRFAPRLRELVGYGVYNGLIGHIDKRSPAKLLGDDGGQRMVWEY
jgi:ectoine hydroxylase-related dioxygenase (phytanoyl-CoA dioxygenase family)